MVESALDTHVYRGEEVGGRGAVGRPHPAEGEVPWDEFFGALRDLSFDGLATVSVFGWEERRGEIHRRMLKRVKKELQNQ